jgi:hypothetical protein
METFNFSSKGDIFNIDIKNDVVTFKPRNKKCRDLLKDLGHTTKLSLKKPEEVSNWFINVSNKIGASAIVLEIYSYKFSPLEDLIPKRLRDEIFYPELFNTSSNISKYDVDCYFDTKGYFDNLNEDDSDD